MNPSWDLCNRTRAQTADAAKGGRGNEMPEGSGGNDTQSAAAIPKPGNMNQQCDFQGLPVPDCATAQRDRRSRDCMAARGAL